MDKPLEEMRPEGGDIKALLREVRPLLEQINF